MTRLNGSRSFYGYATSANKEEVAMNMDATESSSTQKDTFSCKNENETLYSLLLFLLPTLKHTYEQGCVIAKEELSDVEDQRLKILISTLNALRSKAGWNIPKVYL